MPPINASVTNQQITASVGETQIDVSVSGGVGPTGTAGAAASVTVGTVTTGAPGSSASVVNAGTSSAAVLNFTIPAGATGAQGQTGAAGAQGIQGIQGPAGPAGPAGATGATGPAGSNATATTNASLLTSGTLDAARLPGSVVLTTDARLSDARQPLTHQHTAAQISDFAAAVVAAAPPTTNASLLTSGTLPDARLSSAIARTSDITTAVANVVNAAPAALDTLNELAAALGNDASFSATVTNSLASKAPINNPTFTGTVSGVTKSMVGLGNADNTSDASKPISTATQTALDGKAALVHTHTVSAITDAGTAATRNVPATGNASSTEVVLGGDTRLTNQREPTDASVTAAKIAADQIVSFRAITVSGGSFFTGWGIRLVASPLQIVEDTSGTILFLVGSTGIVTSGQWQATAIGVAYGGTGATTASAARTNLGLAIGTDVAAASHTHGFLSASGGLLNAAGSEATATVAMVGIAGTPSAGKLVAATSMVGLSVSAVSNTLFVTYGSTAFTACQGNDSRLSDARTPTAHKASHSTGGSDALTPADIGAAASSHNHSSSSITDFASAVAAASPEEVVEYLTAASFPATGNASLLYLATDSARAYRWVGSQYAEIGPTSVSAGGGSSADSVLRALFVPPAPTSLAASPGNAQATLSWSAPSVVAQAPITDYVVQFSSDSGSTWTTFADGTSTATSATVTGLTNGTAYVFRVAAVNAVGTGAYTAASSAATPGAFNLTKAASGVFATASGSGTIASPLAWSGSVTTASAVTMFTVATAGTLNLSLTLTGGSGEFGADLFEVTRNGSVVFTPSLGSNVTRSTTFSVSVGDVIRINVTNESSASLTAFSARI
jgi:hypothetical protein